MCTYASEFPPPYISIKKLKTNIILTIIYNKTKLGAPGFFRGRSTQTRMTA